MSRKSWVKENIKTKSRKQSKAILPRDKHGTHGWRAPFFGLVHLLFQNWSQAYMLEPVWPLRTNLGHYEFFINVIFDEWDCPSFCSYLMTSLVNSHNWALDDVQILCVCSRCSMSCYDQLPKTCSSAAILHETLTVSKTTELTTEEGVLSR